MSQQRTIVEQKQQFLQAKKLFLSHGITPSERLKTIAEEGGIELSVLKGVIDKVNRDIKQHSRRVYSRQMIDHVVEQIDELYWQAGSSSRDDADDALSNDPMEDTDTLYQGDDLTLDENIAKLPTVWDISADPPSARNTSVTQDDYLAALARVQDLAAKRQALQNDLNTANALLELLEPFRQPKESVQPNLVWKDSPLVPELSKTRTLAIRVAGRINEKFGDVQVPATADEEDVDMDSLDAERRKKVDAVLENW